MKGGGDGDDAARQWWCGSAAWWWSEVGHGGELVVYWYRVFAGLPFYVILRLTMYAFAMCGER